MPSESNKKKIYVIGHLHPDSDSICAAIGYSALKNALAAKLGLDEEYIPSRAGEISDETNWVLNRFQLQPPFLLSDVTPRLRDVSLQKIEGVSKETSIKDAWRRMHQMDASLLPILSEDGTIAGLLGIKDIAIAFMNSLDTHLLSNAKASYAQIAQTLSGELVYAAGEGMSENGKIIVAAGDHEAIKRNTTKGDIVLLSNREESQLAAIEMGAGALVICLSSAISPAVIEQAKEKGCTLISTPMDTYTASYFINQSVPCEYFMKDKALETFEIDQTLDEVLSEMSTTRHAHFPVVDEKNRYCGTVSRRRLLTYNKKNLILVDHNEKTQCVQGWEKAEILEIIDHHRVGGLQTTGPIVFRNCPLGSTATIIYKLYKENGMTPEKNIAGALCCAVLSDTLKFRSPTCTKEDIQTAEELSAICGCSVDELAQGMFEAGENITGKSSEELLHQDYKEFNSHGATFMAAQLSFFSKKTLKKAAVLMREEMEKEFPVLGADYLFVMLTDIDKESCYLLYIGGGAEELLRIAFPDAEKKLEDKCIYLPGVVSRKKQLIPAILEALTQLKEK